MEKFRPGPAQNPNELPQSAGHSEYWPTEGKDMKELGLDMASIGLFVIGIRAYLQPERYGDSEFIQNAIETARVAGFITNEGVNLPQDIAEIAYPTNLNIRHQ